MKLKKIWQYLCQRSSPIKLMLMLTLLDQLTKYIASHAFSLNVNVPVTSRLVIFPTINETGNGVLDKIHVFNSHLMLLISVSLLVLVAGLWRYALKSGFTNQLFYKGLAMIMAGGIGNAIDRLHMKGGLDWLLIKINDNCWPGINVADVAIYLDLITLIVSLLVQVKIDLSLKYSHRKTLFEVVSCLN